MSKKHPVSSGALLRTAIYIRVSTDIQAKKGDSLDEQINTCKLYIENHDNMILQDVYIDDGISGQKLNRSGFAKLMSNVKSDQIDFIIFTKLDRWFRNLRHYLNTQALLEKYGVNWLAVSQPFFDTSTPQGRAFVAQSMTFAELEAQNDSERILSVFDYKYKRGEVLSGSVPLGYSIVDKHLQPNSQAAIVLDLFKFYARNGSLNATVQYLEIQYGIVKTQASVKRILTNRKYIGEFRDNLNYCPAIVPRDLFEEVQRKLSSNVKATQKYNYIFSGLIKCRCGHFCTGSMIRNNKYKYPVYRCTSAYPYKRCTNRKVVNEHTLEKYLLKNIKPLISQYLVEYEISSKAVVDIDKQRSVIMKKINKLKDLYVNDLITIDEFKADKTRYMSQLEKLGKQSEPTKDLAPLRKFLKFDIESIYASMTSEEKRYLWRSVIKEIITDEEHNYTIIFL